MLGIIISTNINIIAQKQGFESSTEIYIDIAGRINHFHYDRYNQLTNQSKFTLHPNTTQYKQFLTSKWKISTSKKTIIDNEEAIEYQVQFTCIDGGINSANISIDIDIDNWNGKNYVLMPAAVYNGNRYSWRRLRYSPKLHDIKDIGIEKPIIINDVPKLNDSSGISRIQERSGSMSTPSLGFFHSDKQKVVWLLTEQKNELGDYGIDIEENRKRSKATISINSPVVRELFTYQITNAHTPSWDKPANFVKGNIVTIKFRLYQFDGKNIQTIFDKFSIIRKSMTPKTDLINTIPYSECMEVLEKKFNQYNFVKEYGYYAIGMRENYLQDWQIGWTGGMISTYPLLFAGNEQTKQNVIRNFDWLFPNGISPSGFYWDAGQKGTEWIGGDIRNFHTKNWHLIRKSGDAIWYITKQFMLMEKQNIIVKQSWKEGNEKVCNAFVQLWNKYHQLGQFVDSKSGEIIVGGSSSGAIVPAALALASNYYHEPKYLQIAEEVGEYFYQNFTKLGISCGGPGDALQAFDSESAYALVESYIALYENTNNTKWLTYAEYATKQFATWVVSYNYKYNDTTAFAKANMHTIGGVYANIQNKHSAPGICTASGNALLKIFRYTNNTFYIELLQDISKNITQYLPHPLKPLGNAPIGWVSERVNMTDWEGPQSIGYILPISTWAETSLMLTTIQIPGIYIDLEKGTATAFDNVDVKRLTKPGNKLI
ncbi:MAG: hypothetical protein ACOVNY_11500, partial [Chitinophagaceae bacterium]